MKINLNQIPDEGSFVLEENISPGELDLDTEVIKFKQPIKVRAIASRITNVVSVDLAISSRMTTECSRCLIEVEIGFNKAVKLNYQVESNQRVIDLNPEIREEMVLDYPVKPLCTPDCKGLCAQCGKPLNEGGCSCGST